MTAAGSSGDSPYALIAIRQTSAEWFHRRRLAHLVLVVVLALTAGLVGYLTIERGTAPEPAGGVGIPAFEMTREVVLFDVLADGTTASHAKAVYQLSYLSEHSWRETLIARDPDVNSVSKPGDYVRWDGERTFRSINNGPEMANGPLRDGIFVPGPWFMTEGQLTARARQGDQEYEIRQDGGLRVLAVSGPMDVTEYAFEPTLPVPVDVKVLVDGRVAREERATSLTVDGKKVR